MKIVTKPTAIETSCQFVEFDFGIKESDMGMILEILRNKLYSNPIGAICREIASNSRDANREAENNVPIEIAISNSVLSASDMTISFKDCGPGISPERMADVFVNYGSSTKRDSDEYTGGFGLGAKTPFSYADSFTIETVVDGVKYTYVAAIEEGRKGKIYCVDNKETCENNGTTIIIPIKSGDRDTFEREVYKATIFWPMQPLYKNFNYKHNNMEVVYENNELMLVKQLPFINNNYGLLLDGIFYPISGNDIEFAYDKIADHLVVFKYNVGELTISANRETLQYDDATKKAINIRCCNLVSLAMDTYAREFSKLKTWFEAVLSCEGRENNVFYMICKEHLPYNDPFRKQMNFFDGVGLNTKLSECFQTLQFFEIERDAMGKVSRLKIDKLNKKFITTPVYLFDETMSFIPLKEETIFVNNKEYYAVRPVNPKFLRYWELKKEERKELAKNYRRYRKDVKLLTKLGFKYDLYSTVERMKVVKEANAPKKACVQRTTDTMKVYMQAISAEPEFNERRHGLRREVRPGTYCYLKTNGVYVTYESGKLLDLSKFVVVFVDDIMLLPDYRSNEFSLYKNAVKAKLLDDFSIIYVNRKRGAKLAHLRKLDERFVEVTPQVIGQLLDMNAAATLLNDKKWILDVPYISKKFIDMKASLLPFKEFEGISIYLSDEVKIKYANLSTIASLKILVNDIFITFPLLKVMSRYEVTGNFKAVVQYINILERALIADKTLV